MYIIKFLKWSLVFLAFVAFKQFDEQYADPNKEDVVYVTHHPEK